MNKKGKLLVDFIKKEAKTAMNEISSRAYQKSVAATPSQKSRNAYRLVKQKLSEVEKILEHSGKLNEEMGGWKLNEDQMNFIREKIGSIREKSKGIISEDMNSSIISDITSFINGIKDPNAKIKTLDEIIKVCKQFKLSTSNPIKFNKNLKEGKLLKENISIDDVNAAALTLHNYAKQTGNLDLGELVKKLIQTLPTNESRAIKEALDTTSDINFTREDIIYLDYMVSKFLKDGKIGGMDAEDTKNRRKIFEKIRSKIISAINKWNEENG